MTQGVRLEIGERTLANGLTLLAVKNPGVATFAAAVSLDILDGDESARDCGFINLVGDCLD